MYMIKLIVVWGIIKSILWRVVCGKTARTVLWGEYKVIYISTRYIIIIHNDYNYLVNIKNKIEKELNNNFKLKINTKKTMITDNSNGFTFLGYRFRIINNKTIINVSNSTRIRIKKRIKEVNYLYKHDKIKLQTTFSSINTYLYGFKYGSRLRIKRIINDKFF